MNKNIINDINNLENTITNDQVVPAADEDINITKEQDNKEENQDNNLDNKEENQDDNSDDDNIEKCAICIDKIDDKKNLVITKCKHMFHFTCMIKFIENKFINNGELQCPMCKEQFKEQSEIKSENSDDNDDSDDSNSTNSTDSTNLSVVFENINDRNNTIGFNNYLGNIRASSNNSVSINLNTGLWEQTTNNSNNINNYFDNTSDINSELSDDEMLESDILNLIREINS
jgi:hypothetical protein